MMHTIESICDAINAGRLIFTVGYEPDRNGQTAKAKNYMGEPRRESGLNDNILWKPEEGKLSWWATNSPTQRGDFVVAGGSEDHRRVCAAIQLEIDSHPMVF